MVLGAVSEMRMKTRYIFLIINRITTVRIYQRMKEFQQKRTGVMQDS